MKKILSIFLCCALTVSLLAGCAGNTGKTDPTKETEVTGMADN